MINFIKHLNFVIKQIIHSFISFIRSFFHGFSNGSCRLAKGGPCLTPKAPLLALLLPRRVAGPFPWLLLLVIAGCTLESAPELDSIIEVEVLV